MPTMTTRRPENHGDPLLQIAYRCRCRFAAICVWAVLVSFWGCTTPSGDVPPGNPPPEAGHLLVGAWVRPINNHPEIIEGLRFDSDGRFGLIGIHSMHGLDWKLEDADLIVTTNTGRYPEPFVMRLSIQTLTATTLILEGDKGYFRGAWRRDDAAAGRITGHVTYRERIALPPDAAVHLTLEDVSRQDAPATFIAGQAIPVQGRQVPIPFALYYASGDIDSRHTYQVRAAIVVDGQRRFLTTQAYPVLTRGHPDHVEMTVQGVPQTPTSPAHAPDRTLRVEDMHLPATYSGQLNRPNGNTGRITLNLYPSRMFLLRKPVGTSSGGAKAFDHDHGRWYLAHGGRQLVLVGRAEAPYKLAIRDSETFRLLGLNGSEDRLQQPVDLIRKAELDPFVDPVPMTGMFRYMADAALFTDCLTATSFPVAQEKDYLTLERAYLTHRQAAGEPLFVTLTGHLEQRPKMEGVGLQTVVVVDRFETIRTRAACPARPALAELENTYWKLTELYGKTVQFAAAGRGEPHLMLRPPERQMSGFSGCNGFFGLYRTDGRQLSFEDTGATMMACPRDLDLEKTFFRALQTTGHFKIFGEMLELYDGRKVVARFEAVYF